MEWGEGAIKAANLLSTRESAQMYAERLTELALALGFDGWLINMEVDDVEQISNLTEFVSHLTQTMHSSLPGSLVIWYDSVTIEGKLEWQNQLNDKNKPFFDVCDGIFVNYTWEENYARQSAEVAGDRKFDVYMGIDVFGRGTYGGGQWNTNVALDVIRESDVSAAIFAPGWVYENNDKQEFQTLQNRWWGLVEKSWGVVQKYPRVLPFYSNFDQGRGRHVSSEGRQVSDVPWNNISSQSLQPFLEFSEDSNPDAVKCYVDFNEASYSGGGNITFRGTLENNKAPLTARLFEGELLLGSSPINIVYSVKSNWNSLLGLAFGISSDAKEKKTIFLASQANSLLTMEHFSSQFTDVIMPHRVTSSEADPKWATEEFSISEEGYTLTEVYAAFYKLPESSNQQVSTSGNFDYHAVMGYIRISSSVPNNLPPSNLWHLEAQHVKWTWSSEDELKYLSAKIIWKLLNGNADIFPRYYVYIKKLSESSVRKQNELVESEAEYLGMAQVEAFYVSDLVVPPGTSSLKFIVQVFGVDGECQKLEECPFLLLAAKGGV